MSTSLTRNEEADAMTAKILNETQAMELDFDDDHVILTLTDCRVLTVPLWFYPRLKAATDAQRRNFRWIGGGIGIHWPDIDEDLSVAGFLLGLKARTRPRGAGK
jgi:hypothetical protein